MRFLRALRIKETSFPRRELSFQMSPSFVVAFVALVALAFVAFLGKSYENTLRGIDSNIHAKASMDVTSSGFLPRLPIPDSNSNSENLTGYFNDHPFFYFWLNGWVMRFFGPSAWSARLLTGFFSAGCVVLTFLVGSQLYSVLFGFLSALFFLLCRDVILTGATVSLDPPMLFFILLSFYLWITQSWKKLALAVGVGLWIKTPVVLLIFPTAFIVSGFGIMSQNPFYQIGRGSSKARQSSIFFGKWLSYFLKNCSKNFLNILLAFLLSLVVGSAVWIVTGLQGGWAWVGDYWIRQLWGTAVNGRNLGHSADIGMFFRMIRNGFLPGLFFLLIGFVRVVATLFYNRKSSSESFFRMQQAFWISLISCGVLFVCITPLKFKMDYYYNPVFPFLAFIASYSVIDILNSVEEWFYSSIGILTSIVLAILLIAPVSLGPESFVALKRFIPLIQSRGNCSDTVVLIPGGEPVGSSLDYQLVLNFYTGRKVDTKTCEEVLDHLKKNKVNPEWMILSSENYISCFSNQGLAEYKSRIQVDNQILMSQYTFEQNKILDLSPLEGEMKAVVDCVPQSYPQDLYHKKVRSL